MSVRTFDGIRYRYETLAFTKADAKHDAKELRKKGALVRVVNEGKGRSGRTVYGIFVNWHHAKYKNL